MRSLNSIAGETADPHGQRWQQTREKLRRFGSLAAIAGLFSVSNVVWGAELSPPPPVAPVPFTWTGIYIGGNAGYAGATIDETISGGGGAGSTSIPSFVGGGQVGFNYQFGAMVVGAEADFDGSTATKSSAAGIISGTEQIPWIGTLRGRLGVAFDRFMVYGTAGGAETELVSLVNAGALGPANTAVTQFAWTAGGGIEFAITDSLSARVEDLYVDTGTFNVAYVAPLVVTGRVQENMVRVGLNYRLPIAW
jgi:outer membrane immunogenic protein